MRPKPFILALSLGLLAAACSDLRCPRNSTRSGDTCHECPEGTWPKDNVCVPTDDAGMGELGDSGGLSPSNPNMQAGMADGGVELTGPDGSVPVPRAENVPTVGGFSTVNEPRKNSASNTLSEDGFELGDTTCTTDGRCLTGSFAP